MPLLFACIAANKDLKGIRLRFIRIRCVRNASRADREGVFYDCMQWGEFELPFTAIIEKPYVMTSVGKVQDMESFRRLAEKDYLEAARLFRSRDFYQILKYEEKRWSNLYSNMRKWSLDEQGLEEFLVGTKQKERIFLTLSEETESFFDLQTSKKKQSVLQKTRGDIWKWPWR